MNTARLLRVSLALVATLARARCRPRRRRAVRPLTSVAIAATTITSATIVAPRPEHCLVVGRVDTEIKFELRLPTTTVEPASSTTPAAAASSAAFRPRPAPSPAVCRHRHRTPVTSATGRSSRPRRLVGADNLERQVNFGHRRGARRDGGRQEDPHAFYGHHERLAYFERLLQRRAPGHAGTASGTRPTSTHHRRRPALDWVGTMTGFVWNEQAANAAPLSVDKVALLAGAVLAACDAKDGLKDGLISDPRRCRFDPKKLQCTAGDAATCLTAGAGGDRPGASITAPRAPTGRPLYSGGRRGTRTAPRPAGRSGSPVTKRSRRCNSSSRTATEVTSSSIRASNLLTSDLESDVRAERPTGRFLKRHDADLSDFSAAGGKLIMWHGWADAALTRFRSIAYLEEAAEKTKHGKPARRVLRLFLAPGMHHCGGGPGPNTWTRSPALESWVEHGSRPSRSSPPNMTGPWSTGPDRCARTRRRRPTGTRQRERASSFVCRVPRDLSDHPRSLRRQRDDD